MANMFDKAAAADAKKKNDSKQAGRKNSEEQQFALVLPKELHKKIKIESAVEGKTMNEIIVNTLGKAFK